MATPARPARTPRPATKPAPAAPQPAAKPAPKPAAKPAPAPKADQPSVKTGKKAGKGDKPEKAPKQRSKPVRDSFTMPEADFALIATLKARALSAGRETKKSELLRAGLHALAALQTSALAAALSALEPVKVGRPKKGH